MTDIKFLNCPKSLNALKPTISAEIKKFLATFDVLENEVLHILTDLRTNSFFSECHLLAASLIEHGTIDVPLDPESQSEYRANRDPQEDHSAYKKMVDDAQKKRMFSNIVCEFNSSYQPEKPIKIIGGQHRFMAIETALSKKINEYHGIKVYFLLDKEQRLDIQLISNSNIAVSPDLLDRMFETAKGPELRHWAQAAGLLGAREDFTDKKGRGSQISVRAARSFILNFYVGKKIDERNFDKKDTTPILTKTGIIDHEWEKLRSQKNIWEDRDLLTAAKHFAKLHKAQYEYFTVKTKGHFEFAEKALGLAVLSAWAFVAGVLSKNKLRLERHFELANQKNSDPLSANLMAKGKHKTDPDAYRGLGTRTDPKERGRLSELFYLQTEKGGGFTGSMIDLAIKKYHAKQSQLEVFEAEKKLGYE